MNWLVAYLLIGLLIVLFFWVGLKSNNWKDRFKGWLLLLLPVVIYMWDYPVVYYQHQRDCKTEGGLKVFIKPEKVDRIQLEGGSFDEVSAESLLQHFSPKLSLVEAVGDSHESIRDPHQYFAYSVSFIPKDPPGIWGAYATPWKFNKIPLQKRSEGMYIISKRYEHDKSAHREKTEWLLMRNGKLYAKWTEFLHYWPGIHYPDAIPHWRCPDPDTLPRRYADEELINLILK